MILFRKAQAWGRALVGGLTTAFVAGGDLRGSGTDFVPALTPSHGELTAATVQSVIDSVLGLPAEGADPFFIIELAEDDRIYAQASFRRSRRQALAEVVGPQYFAPAGALGAPLAARGWLLDNAAGNYQQAFSPEQVRSGAMAAAIIEALGLYSADDLAAIRYTISAG